MASGQQKRMVSDMDPPSLDTLIADLDETLKNDDLREKLRRLQSVGNGRVSSISASPGPQPEPQNAGSLSSMSPVSALSGKQPGEHHFEHSSDDPSQDLGLGGEHTPLPAATLPSQSPSTQLQSDHQSPSELRGADILPSTESTDDDNDSSLMINVVARPSSNASSRATSVIRHPVSNSPSPTNYESEIAYLKEKFETFTQAVLERQEKDKEELWAVWNKLDEVFTRQEKDKEEFDAIKRELETTRQDLHYKDDQLVKVQRQLNRNYSDHRRDLRELSFDLSSQIATKDKSLAQVYQRINELRADHAQLQEESRSKDEKLKQLRTDHSLLQAKVKAVCSRMNAQSEEIKKNAEEIALHAREDWQDVQGK